MVEVNFERKPEARKIFRGDLSPRVLIPALSAYFNAELTPGKSLLFLDEIQECPEAIKSLRYFYEECPALHVIGAGSLLEFELARTGVPVGRVDFLQLHPLSFLEFLSALGETSFMEAVATHPLDQPLNSALHEKGLDLVKLYTAVGGLPEVVSAYIDGAIWIGARRFRAN
jgi:predicted AAA+ superfamily ATPase